MSFIATDSAKALTTTWLTPIELIRQLGEFDLDPCGYPGHLTATFCVCLPQDGLAVEWFGRVWLNPPYGKEAAVWMQRLQKHGDGIALLFARLETSWLKPFLRDGFFVMDGRISFYSPTIEKLDRAGCASILVPFGRKNIGAILSSDIPGEWYQ